MMFPNNSGAHFSDDRVYRYTLWRSWSGQPYCLFVMLNPSTADEVQNDPTVERCERRARGWGFGGLIVCNIFALRSTDPSRLYSHPDPIGPENDAAIRAAALRAGLTICAWGKHGWLRDRGTQVRELLRKEGIAPSYLRMNRDGSPGHPLYLPYALQPEVWA